MDEKLAWQMVRVSFRTAGELQELLGLLKENCNAEDYQTYAGRIAQAIDSVNDALLGTRHSKRTPSLQSGSKPNSKSLAGCAEHSGSASPRPS